MIRRGQLLFRRGISLVETLVGLGVFAVIAISVYQAYTTLLAVFSNARAQFLAGEIANEEIELIRNIPYEQVGIENGIPRGVIKAAQTIVRGGLTFVSTTTIRNIDDPFDGVACPQEGCGGIVDSSPADYRLIELEISCSNCRSAQSYRFTGRVAPKNLEAASTNGSLFIQAIDANGRSVSGATVQVVNPTIQPAVNIIDSTGIDGFLRILDVPPAPQSYVITVGKPGYSTDRTYATSTANPNPVTSHATVAAQTVTQVSFAIDRVSTLNVSSVGETCSPIPGIGFSLAGAKLIGTNPDVLKYQASFSTAPDGAASVGSLEWDTYTATTTTQQGGYDLSGTIPLSPVTVLPASTQSFKFVMRSTNQNSLLVTVKDAATGLPLSGASVNLTKAGYSNTLITGRGFLVQTDWSLGSGQAQFVNPAMYAEDDGNVSVVTPPGEVKLKEILPPPGGSGAFRIKSGIIPFARAFAWPQYAPSGTLTSSTFDTGSASSFYTLTFQPTSQPPEAGADAVRFQFAATNTPNPASWDFRGPDGTAATYYTAGNTSVPSLHNGNRYFRYKLSLGTASTTFTPSVSDVAVTFASECVPPGQTFFNGLSFGDYTLTVSLGGYTTVVDSATIASGWQSKDIILSPSAGGGGLN